MFDPKAILEGWIICLKHKAQKIYEGLNWPLLFGQERMFVLVNVSCPKYDKSNYFELQKWISSMKIVSAGKKASKPWWKKEILAKVKM